MCWVFSKRPVTNGGFRLTSLAAQLYSLSLFLHLFVKLSIINHANIFRSEFSVQSTLYVVVAAFSFTHDNSDASLNLIEKFFLITIIESWLRSGKEVKLCLLSDEMHLFRERTLSNYANPTLPEFLAEDLQSISFGWGRGGEWLENT